MEYQELQHRLKGLDQKNYKLYKSIKGYIKFPQFTLSIDHVQGDPFAAPSKMRAFISQEDHLIPPAYFSNSTRIVALRDYLNRCFFQACITASQNVGTGKGGLIEILKPGQQILDSSACLVEDKKIELRFSIGLPANGRRILGHEAARLLGETLPDLIQSIFYPKLKPEHMLQHVNCHEDNVKLRSQLNERGLIAFIGNGSRLARASGIDDRPLSEQQNTPFQSPKSLEVMLDTVHKGKLVGMGIPKGISLIVGGGYHGKSTLLRAVELGIYSHIPGDGREGIVSEPTAFKVRSEDGRSISSVPIHPFINNLPGGKSTKNFSSPNASGSTSQAATIMEAIELGCQTLLIDEDSSASNFMTRDRRMQELIADEDEPITPFVDCIEELKDRGVSSLIVMGGSGAYLGLADNVIGMKNYLAQDYKEAVGKLLTKFTDDRLVRKQRAFHDIPKRTLLSDGLSPRQGRHAIKIRTREKDEIQYGKESIDMSHIEQVAHQGQLNCIAYFLAQLHETVPAEGEALPDAIERTYERWQSEGYDAIQLAPDGDMVAVRRIDIACALNRLRSLKTVIKINA